jgi:hypothetical protein
MPFFAPLREILRVAPNKKAAENPEQIGFLCGLCVSALDFLAAHRSQELAVGASFPQLIEQQLHRFHRR